MMSVGIWMFPALFVLIAAGIPVAFSMMGVALAFGLVRFGDAAISLFMSKVVDVSSNYVLGAIPLFVFMGAILQHSGIAERLFDAIYLWTKRMPGGLALGAMLMCTVFAAATGVAGATESLVGMLAIPPMLKYGYDRGLISGTICAGGSLGTTIPPSITVIVLAPIANVPVGSLFAGLMFPGLIMSGLFLLYIALSCLVWPDTAPRPPETDADRTSLWTKMRITFAALVPTIILIFAVLGTILLGWATPTEAAACGAFGSLALAAIHRRLTFPVLRDALYNTLSVTAMILLIVLAGSMFAGVFYVLGGMTAVQGVLDHYGIVGWPAIAMVLVVTFIAGFILDLISVILILVPVAMPLVTIYGFDPLLFCVLFLIVIQTSYLTPPMAPSIFYLRAIAPPEIRLTHMYRGVTPFILLQILTFAIVVAFPQLATWLPEVLY